MLNVIIKTIPHKKQVYPTVGDWRWRKDGTLLLFISDMGNWKFEFLVAFHEFFEAMLCKFLGIKQEDVDTFDIQYEKDRKLGLHGPDEEPGDDEDAPYRIPHFWATTLERTAAALLNVNWQVYSKVVENL